MRFLRRLVILFCLGLQPLSAAEQSESTKIPEIAAAADAYKKTVTNLYNTRTHRNTKATKDYLGRLEQLRKEFTTAGDFDAVAAVKKEQERLGKGDNPSADQKKAMPGKLLGLREAYERDCAPANKLTEDEKGQATTKFLADLEAVEDRLAKANRMDRVKVIKALRTKITEKGEVPDNPTEPNVESVPIGPEKLHGPLAAKIITAIAAKTTKQGPLSAKSDDSWTELPEDGAILIGFEISEKNFDGGAGIKTLRPIFLCAEGTFTGKLRGKNPGKIATVKAKPGFAVMSFNTFTQKHLEGIQFVFAKFDSATGKFLTDPQNTYTSKWYGSKGKGAPVECGGKGSLIVGVYGKSGDEAETIGPIVMP